MNANLPDATNSSEQEITLRDDERQTCEVWTRVMGYHRPTTSFNVGKQGEFAERKYFREGSDFVRKIRE